MKQGKGLHMVTFLLLVIGGLNWLLVGVFGWDVGELFGGQGAIVSRVIYILVGLSALYEVITHKSSCCGCGGGCGSCGAEKGGACDTCPRCGKSPCACGGGENKESEQA